MSGETFRLRRDGQAAPSFPRGGARGGQCGGVDELLGNGTGLPGLHGWKPAEGWTLAFLCFAWLVVVYRGFFTLPSEKLREHEKFCWPLLRAFGRRGCGKEDFPAPSSLCCYTRPCLAVTQVSSARHRSLGVLKFHLLCVSCRTIVTPGTCL